MDACAGTFRLAWNNSIALFGIRDDLVADWITNIAAADLRSGRFRWIWLGLDKTTDFCAICHLDPDDGDYAAPHFNADPMANGET